MFIHKISPKIYRCLRKFPCYTGLNKTLYSSKKNRKKCHHRKQELSVVLALALSVRGYWRPFLSNMMTIK